MSKFTDEQEQDIVKRYRNNEQQQDIAKLYSCSRSLITKIVGKHKAQKFNVNKTTKKRDQKFENDVLRLAKEGLTRDEIAIELKRGISSISRVLKDFNISTKKIIKISEELKNQIIVLYKDNISIHKIAVKLNINLSSIRKIIQNIKSIGTIATNFQNNKKPQQPKQQYDFKLPNFKDSPQWFAKIYNNKWGNPPIYIGSPTIAKCIYDQIKDNPPPGFEHYTFNENNYKQEISRLQALVNRRLTQHRIKRRSISESSKIYNEKEIIFLYKKYNHSMQKVAKELDCSIETIKTTLLKNDIKIYSASEQFSGEGNPFYGKEHSPEIIEKCRQMGGEASRKFWEENPEYREVVKEVQKEIWSDPQKREEQSKKIAQLMKKHNFNYKGEVETRFGKLRFDSSYEADFIKLCTSLNEIVSLEKNFDIIGYKFDNIKYNYIPDFRIKLKDNREIIIEIKADNLLLDAKTLAKNNAGKEKYSNYLMINNDFGPFIDWIYKSETPFNFKDITISSTVPKKQI